MLITCLIVNIGNSIISNIMVNIGNILTILPIFTIILLIITVANIHYKTGCVLFKVMQYAYPKRSQYGVTEV